MEVTSSAWRTVDCSLYGVSMAVGESVVERFNNISLTIPRLRRQGVGTLVVTSKRFVFLLPGPFQAYTCKLSSFIDVRPIPIPAFPDFLCLYVELADEYFTFQGKREDILHIQASMSECDITATLVMKTMRKVAPARPKKVIGAVGGPVGIAHVHGLAEERMRSDKEVVASIKSLNALKERAEILLRFAEDLRNSASGGKTMDALQRVCIAVGIESPVENVRGDAGLRQLATEFAEVIETVFKAGGTPPVLTKAEAYAIYLRARKANLLSPKDVDKAIQLIEQSKVYGIRVERLGTLQVVVPKGKSFVSGVLKRFKKMGKEAFYTPMSLAKEAKIPLTMAKLFLNRGVEYGVIAMDETISGVRYYKNRFDKFKLMKF